MLQSLSISNYALIQKLELTPSLGLNVITGETGAGKSIMLGAVGLLLGNRADTKVLLNKEDKCIVEGEFDLTPYQLKTLFETRDLDYEENTIIRREITPTGKSRAFINDSPVTLDILKELGANLMDVHSQHETRFLGKTSFQLDIIDAYSESQKIKNSYSADYNTYVEAKEKLSKLLAEEASIRKEFDFNNFQLEELQKANFEVDEQRRLEEESELLSNSEEIKSHLNTALSIIDRSEYSANENLQTLLVSLRSLSKLSNKFDEILGRSESLLIELKDITLELESLDGAIEHDPRKSDEVQERLSHLYHLQQKHGVLDIQGLLEIQKNLEEKVEKFLGIDGSLEAAREEESKRMKVALQSAKDLSKNRTKIFDQFQTEAQAMLTGLGMNEAKIEFNHKEKELGPDGIDDLEIMFSANKGIAPESLKKVASGGEYSRLMFVIKYLLASRTSMPIIIFDEIDTGVSGEIGIKLGDMMREMSKNHQVIAISHLPQIAGKAKHHYFVYKDEESTTASSKIRQLNDKERIEEVAKMIAGAKPSDSAYASARELMHDN